MTYVISSYRLQIVCFQKNNIIKWYFNENQYEKYQFRIRRTHWFRIWYLIFELTTGRHDPPAKFYHIFFSVSDCIIYQKIKAGTGRYRFLGFQKIKKKVVTNSKQRKAGFSVFDRWNLEDEAIWKKSESYVFLVIFQFTFEAT